MIVLPIFGLAFMLIALIFLFKMKKMTRTGIKTEGTVVDVEHRKNSKSVYPVIRFQTTGNEWISKTPGFFTFAKVPVKGDTVKVIYNPDNPTDFVVESNANPVTPFLLIGLSFILLWGVLKWLHVHF